MCYSTLIKANLKALAMELGAKIDLEQFAGIYALRLSHPELKIPFALDRHFVLSQEPAEKPLASLAMRFHEEEALRSRALLARLEEELCELSTIPTAAARKKLEAGERKREKLRSRLTASFDRISPLDERIFPGSFAPVAIHSGETRLLVPMRYRVRAPDGTEIPYKYNVFNARRDSLLRAPTWAPLLGRAHGIFPFSRFFEWVERPEGKREIAFTPENRSLMWAASLHSYPSSRTALPYHSFAMLTDEPPPEVAAAGHDRCPIFLGEKVLDTWLRPQPLSREELLALLSEKEKAHYLHSLVA